MHLEGRIAILPSKNFPSRNVFPFNNNGNCYKYPEVLTSGKGHYFKKKLALQGYLWKNFIKENPNFKQSLTYDKEFVKKNKDKYEYHAFLPISQALAAALTGEEKQQWTIFNKLFNNLGENTFKQLQIFSFLYEICIRTLSNSQPSNGFFVFIQVFENTKSKLFKAWIKYLIGEFDPLLYYLLKYSPQISMKHFLSVLSERTSYYGKEKNILKTLKLMFAFDLNGILELFYYERYTLDYPLLSFIFCEGTNYFDDFFKAAIINSFPMFLKLEIATPLLYSSATTVLQHVFLDPKVLEKINPNVLLEYRENKENILHMVMRNSCLYKCINHVIEHLNCENLIIEKNEKGLSPFMIFIQTSRDYDSQSQETFKVLLSKYKGDNFFEIWEQLRTMNNNNFSNMWLSNYIDKFSNEKLKQAYEATHNSKYEPNIAKQYRLIKDKMIERNLLETKKSLKERFWEKFAKSEATNKYDYVTSDMGCVM